MQSWLDGSNWVGKCAQSTGMTASLRILSSKADSNTWESFTRSKLKLESLSRPRRPFMNSKSALSWPRRPFMNSLPVLSRQQGRSWTLCLSCHGRKAVLELSACPVMAKEAIHEPSACPVTAMETVHELTVCTVASMETAQELSACSVTVKWSVLFSAQTWIPALPAPPWIHAPLDLTWWSPGLRSAIAPWPRSSTVPQSATDPWPRTSIDPQSAFAPWPRASIDPQSAFAPWPRTSIDPQSAFAPWPRASIVPLSTTTPRPRTSSAPWSRPTSAPWLRPALAPGSRSTTVPWSMSWLMVLPSVPHSMPWSRSFSSSRAWPSVPSPVSPQLHHPPGLFGFCLGRVLH